MLSQIAQAYASIPPEVLEFFTIIIGIPAFACFAFLAYSEL